MTTPDIKPLPYIDYSAIPDRPKFELPDNARVAFWVAPNIEAYEFIPVENRYARPYLRMPPPDVLSYAYLDYGNRVGFWRMIDILDQHDVRPSVSLNVEILEHYPEIAEAMLERSWSFFSHGTYNTRFLYGMSEEEESAWVAENLEIFERHTGQKLKGMFGPFLTQTPRSMQIWAKAGIDYVVDWFLDDQPVLVRTDAGALINVPYGFETNDALVMGGLYKRGGNFEVDYFTKLVKDQFDVLYAEGEESGRVFCLALHPFVIGHPWRVQCLDEILSYVLSHPRVWSTTAEEIASLYRQTADSSALVSAASRSLAELGATDARERNIDRASRGTGADVAAPRHYQWSPISSRPRLQWPNDASVAVALLLTVEYLELEPPLGSMVAPSALYGGPYPVIFDPPPVAHHEYGNRVGAFRIMRLIEELGLPAALVTDVGVARHANPVVKAAADLQWEIVAHGLAASRMVSEEMSNAEEQTYVRQSLDELEALAGIRPRGWLAPDYGESSRSIEILCSAGVDYVCDWPNDEQPYRMTSTAGSLVSLPVSIEADDVFTNRQRGVPIDRWATSAVAALDRLRIDGRTNGRVWVLNMHAYSVGQPFRFKHLEVVLRHLVSFDDVWIAKPGEIVDWFTSR